MSKQLKSNRIVLASGDFANTHAVVSDKQMPYEHLENSVIKFGVDLKNATVTHEEHDIIMLPPGTYYKFNQVEFNPFTQSVSFVFD
jgi:hypothetical protein